MRELELIGFSDPCNSEALIVIFSIVDSLQRIKCIELQDLGCKTAKLTSGFDEFMSAAINTFKGIQQLINSATQRLAGKGTDAGPVYVFHHIPKCGGTSLLKALASWFILVKDYMIGWKMNYPEITSLDKLTSRHCLCGHFELEGYYLCQRYPEVLLSGRYRVFTFVRDPLLLTLSLYRYERENKLSVPSSVEEYLLVRPNFMATILQTTENDYREVVDRYFFVGILEEAQESLDLLANLIGRKGLHMPVRNRTRPVPGTGVEELSSELVAKFREINRLDYLIYAYCLERYEKIKNMSMSK